MWWLQGSGAKYTVMSTCTGYANKKQSPRKNAVFQPRQYGFEPNFQILYVSMHTTYRANFIKITDTVPQIQQFKL